MRIWSFRLMFEPVGWRYYLCEKTKQQQFRVTFCYTFVLRILPQIGILEIRQQYFSRGLWPFFFLHWKLVSTFNSWLKNTRSAYVQCMDADHTMTLAWIKPSSIPLSFQVMRKPHPCVDQQIFGLSDKFCCRCHNI